MRVRRLASERAPTLVPAPKMTFHTTRWSVVLGAGSPDSAAGRAALEELCATYWYPLYAYARHRGKDAASAADLTQGFIVTLLERPFLADVDPARGRFRAYLRVAFDRFLINEHARETAAKRGAGRVLSLDFDDGERRFRAEPSHDETPAALYERRFARCVIDQALSALREDYAREGQLPRFELLRPLLLADDREEPTSRGPDDSCEPVSSLSPGARRVALHRLRARFRERLRTTVAETVHDPRDVDDELRELVAAFSAPRRRV